MHLLTIPNKFSALRIPKCTAHLTGRQVTYLSAARSAMKGFPASETSKTVTIGAGKPTTLFAVQFQTVPLSSPLAKLQHTSKKSIPMSNTDVHNAI
jgi:hypothetical protein